MLTLALAPGLFSCENKESLLGAPYFQDTIGFKTITTQDTSIIHHSAATRSIVFAAGKTALLNSLAGDLFVGNVEDPASGEHLRVLSVLKFTPLLDVPIDSLAQAVSATLTLHAIPYLYGDESNTNVDLLFYTRANGSSSDSSAPTLNDLSATPIASYNAPLSKDSAGIITVTLDSAQLHKFNSEIVIVGGPTLRNVRAFESAQSPTTANVPVLSYNLNINNAIVTVNRNPVLDFHYVYDSSTINPGEFSLRGSLAQRERFMIDQQSLSKVDTISPFSTINSALLVLRVDPTKTRHSASVNDTLGPVVVQLANSAGSDDSSYLISQGVRDPKDPTLYQFQIRKLVETWLRHPELNHGFELRTGYATAYFESVAVGVEDYTINRWTFYGNDAANPADRPKIILTYSVLR